MSVSKVSFDFTVRQSVQNAQVVISEIDKANGDVYISDASSVYNRVKGVDVDHIIVTVSDADGEVGFFAYVKENGVQVGGSYTPCPR